MSEKYSGKFVVVEGGPGSGKSTQRTFMENLGWTGLREPGGTDYGEAIREILQERHDLTIDKIASLFGYMTCRANLVAVEIRPRLVKGEKIVLDRYWSSTYAYQGTEGVNKESILTMSEFATGDLMFPDLFILYDLDPIIGQERKNKNKQRQDRYDIKELDFQYRVRGNYYELANINPGLWEIVDATGTPEEVHLLTIDVLRRRKLVE